MIGMQTTSGFHRTLRLGAAALLVGSILGIQASPSRVQAATRASDSGTSGMGGSGSPMGSDMGDMDMIMTPITGTPTAADQAKVASIVAATRAATKPYLHISAALASGYTHHTPFFPYAHFSNYRYAALTKNGFDPTRPTSLLYALVDTKPTLAGVMYTAPASDTPAQLAEILPSTIVSWHQHLGMCYTATRVMTGQTPAICSSLGGTFAAKSQWMVHAWIYIANPTGMFSIKNPAIPWPTRR